MISGDVTALERAMERARELQAKVIRLKVKVSSHTPLHAEQAEAFAEIIREVPLIDPATPIVSNITSRLLQTAAEVRAEFEAQLRSPVRWSDNVKRMSAEGVDTFVEVGPGPRAREDGEARPGRADRGLARRRARGADPDLRAPAEAQPLARWPRMPGARAPVGRRAA